jgi:hypothetical protein
MFGCQVQHDPRFFDELDMLSVYKPNALWNFLACRLLNLKSLYGFTCRDPRRLNFAALFMPSSFELKTAMNAYYGLSSDCFKLFLKKKNN